MKIKTSDGFILDTLYKKYSKSKCVILVHGMTVDKDDEGIFVTAEPQLNNPSKQIEILRGAEHGFHEESHQTKVTQMIVDFFTDKYNSVESLTKISS